MQVAGSDERVPFFARRCGGGSQKDGRAKRIDQRDLVPLYGDQRRQANEVAARNEEMVAFQRLRETAMIRSHKAQYQLLGPGEAGGE